MLPSRLRVPPSGARHWKCGIGVVGGDAAVAPHARRRRRAGAAAAAAAGRTEPSSSSSSSALEDDDDDGDDFARNGWKRDPRFVRVDFSRQLARRFRRRFALLLAPESGGEARARLAEAALVICAEDDAVAAPTTVPFPVDHWLGRVARLADGAEAAAAAAREQHRLQRQRRRGEDDGATEEEDDEEEEERAVFAAVERFLYDQEGYGPDDDDAASRRAAGPRAAMLAAAGASPSASPWWPRSALKPQKRYDHCGTAEQPRRAYLNEALTRRKGTHPAVLAILLADVQQRLLLRGATRRPAVVGDARRWTGPPTASPARHLTRRAALPRAAAGAGNNAADDGGEWPLSAFPAFDPLLELLRHLKRAYWPFLWDTNADADRDGQPSHPPLPPKKLSHGGFVGAAKAALGEDDDAALRVVSAAAKHRLERGIFTSPGAGDLRRCLAAAERAVLVLDARTATAADPALHAANLALERRDLGALLIHAGRAAEAAAELGAYAEARSASSSSSSSSSRGQGRLVGVPRPWEAGAGARSEQQQLERRSPSANPGGWDTAFEAALADRLLAMARAAAAARGPRATIPPPLTVRRALEEQEEEEGEAAEAGSGAECKPQRHTW